eukprot:scaffold1320_cov326-Prasinococcus_capsulatus_cf.AAC.11
MRKVECTRESSSKGSSQTKAHDCSRSIAAARAPPWLSPATWPTACARRCICVGSWSSTCTATSASVTSSVSARTAWYPSAPARPSPRHGSG